MLEIIDRDRSDGNYYYVIVKSDVIDNDGNEHEHRFGLSFDVLSSIGGCVFGTPPVVLLLFLKSFPLFPT
jgi:hypothetical protein